MLCIGMLMLLMKKKSYNANLRVETFIIDSFRLCLVKRKKMLKKIIFFMFYFIMKNIKENQIQ